ncbi:MAG TPA: hypothetical protein VHT05_15185 [Candidatus Elarobacter sp.]|nr:hypothetical protein [Candidatus Elarobacter sp.]
MLASPRLGYRTALAAIALVVSVPALAQAAVSTGTWSISGAMGNPPVETINPVCVLRLVGSALSGTCRGAAGVGAVTNGVVSGARVTFRWNRIATSAAQKNGIITFVGTLTSSTIIRGTWTDSYRPGGVGTFIGQRHT